MLCMFLHQIGHPQACACVIARLLLKEGKAQSAGDAIHIKLLFQQDRSYTQPLTLGVDTGSSVIGSAVQTSRERWSYLGEVEVRNDIATTMKARAASRRNRRQRKTRYERLDGLNRKNSRAGRFSPHQ